MKNHFFLLTLAIPLSTLQSLNATAAPSAYSSKFGALNIVNSSTSTLVRDSENPNLVWVLPPTSGKVEFSSFRPSANVGFCDGLKSLNMASNALLGEMKTLNQRVANLQPEVQAAEEEFFETKAKEAEATAHPATAQLIALSSEIDANDARLDSLVSQLNTCTGEDACRVLTTEMNDLVTLNRNLRSDLREFRNTNRAQIARFEIAKALSLEAENKLAAIQKRVADYTQQIVSLNGTVKDLYRQNGLLEAGTAFIDYDTKWDENTQALEEAYPQFEFRQVPTRNVRLFAAVSGAANTDAESYFSTLPAVLDYAVNGVKFAPWGINVSDSSALPSKITGDFRMSLIGGCPLLDKTFFDDFDVKPETTRNGDPLYAISANYEYPAAFNRRMRAEFNLFKLYEVMKESSSRGGFFTSKSYSQVVENIPDDRSDFSIEFGSDDATPYTEQEKAQIRKEVKAELVGRVLQQLGTPNNGATRPMAPIDPGAPSTRGAVVLANGLSQTCGFSIYCQAGSWVLRTADSIWGSSHAETSFKSTWNRTASETWSETEVRFVPATTGFSRE